MAGVLGVIVFSDASPAATAPRLKVEPTAKRTLIYEDGRPFFYLGDTAWEIFHRLTEKRGMFIGLLPTWGDKWNRGKWGAGPVIFTPENAAIYGEWIGRRYRERAVIWILGGDRAIENDTHRAIIEEMARGIRRGDGGSHLMTFHTHGGESSSKWFHDADWLDFNMRQNGHEATYERYAGTRRDFERLPVKPVIDGEPIYEDHPISFDAKAHGHSISADCRRALYWDLFNGAFGHTYGHHSVWQMAAPDRAAVNMPLMSWREAIEQPAAAQMQHGRRLIESRPNLDRIPDDALIAPHDQAPSAMPGAGRYRFVAVRDRDASWAMIYAPVGREFTVRASLLSGGTLNAWWFNPRTGQAERSVSINKAETHRFRTPDHGEALDWILVLDDASRSYPAPGTPVAHQR